MSPLIPLAALLAALGLWLSFRLIAASRSRKTARAGFFDRVKPLFDGGEARLEPTGFPRMTGRLGDLAFDLQAIPDALSYRKLPTLWVLVTLPRPMPVAATLDLLARPSGHEPFTRFASLPQSLPPLPGLAPHVAARSDDATGIPPADLIARHLDLFQDDRVKELVISPKGLRIVFLAEEADRGRYLIFRDAEMALDPLAPARLKPILDRLAALRDDLASLKEQG